RQAHPPADIQRTPQAAGRDAQGLRCGYVGDRVRAEPRLEYSIEDIATRPHTLGKAMQVQCLAVGLGAHTQAASELALQLGSAHTNPPRELFKSRSVRLDEPTRALQNAWPVELPRIGSVVSRLCDHGTPSG